MTTWIMTKLYHIPTKMVESDGKVFGDRKMHSIENNFPLNRHVSPDIRQRFILRLFEKGNSLS
jgi:hypothetical protein